MSQREQLDVPRQISASWETIFTFTGTWNAFFEPLVFFVLTQRYFVGGTALSGIKG